MECLFIFSDLHQLQVTNLPLIYGLLWETIINLIVTSKLKDALWKYTTIIMVCLNQFIFWKEALGLYYKSVLFWIIMDWAILCICSCDQIYCYRYTLLQTSSLSGTSADPYALILCAPTLAQCHTVMKLMRRALRVIENWLRSVSQCSTSCELAWHIIIKKWDYFL